MPVRQHFACPRQCAFQHEFINGAMPCRCRGLQDMLCLAGKPQPKPLPALSGRCHALSLLNCQGSLFNPRVHANRQDGFPVGLFLTSRLAAYDLRKTETENIKATFSTWAWRLVFMDPTTETMLAANALIHRYGAGAEEYVSRQLWDSQQSADEKAAAQWRSLLEALRKVREIRKKTET